MYDDERAAQAKATGRAVGKDRRPTATVPAANVFGVADSLASPSNAASATLPQVVKVYQYSASDLRQKLETAVQNGFTVLVEGVGDSIEPWLNPILTKQVYRTGPQMVIQIGDAVVEYDLRFKLYLTTNLANPKFSPDVYSKV